MSAAKITVLLSSLTVGALLIASTPAPVVPAAAGNEVFLRVDGVQGESVVQGYQGWMRMEDFQLSIDNGAKPGAISSTRTPVPVLSNLEVSATRIPNLPELAARCAMATPIKNVTLDVRNLNSGINGPLMKIQLRNAVIARVSTQSTQHGDIRQVVQIAYSHITMTTKDHLGTVRKMTWNVATNSSK